LIIKCDLID